MVDYYEDLADLLANSYEEDLASDESDRDADHGLDASNEAVNPYLDDCTLFLPFPPPFQPPAHR